MATYIRNVFFGATLRQCRKQRNYSQQFVASAAGISSRHLSFVECNKTGVSRKTLTRIFEVLALQPSQEDILLQLVGFSSQRSASNKLEFNETVPWAIGQVLDVYSPYPAYLLDQYLNVLAMNKVSKLYLDHINISLRNFNGVPNLLLSSVDQASLRPYLRNWEEVVRSLIWRLRHHARRSPDPEPFDALEREAASHANVREVLRLDPNERVLHGIDNVVVGRGSASVEFTHITSSLHGTLENGHSPKFFVESFLPENEHSALLFEQYIARFPGFLSGNV